MGVRSVRSTRTIIIAALLGASVTACSRKAPYRLGIVLDRAGGDGAALAAARINEAGGIHGHRLELISISTPVATGRVAVETAERLASDKSVLAVIGHTNSSSSLAASQVYNSRHVLQLSPTTTAPLYGDAGPYSYRLVPSDDRQGAYLAEQVIALRGERQLRIAVMYVNNDYGRPLHGVLRARLHAANIVPEYDAPFAHIDSVVAREFVGELVRARPQLLIWLGRSGDFTPMARSLRLALPDLSIVASDAFSRGAVLVDTTRQFVSIRYVRMVDLGRPDSALQNLRHMYEKTGRGELNDQTVLGYDAVSLLGEALRSAGAHRESLPVWLAQLGRTRPAFNGLSGPIEFTDQRDRLLQYRLVTDHGEPGIVP